MTPQTWVGLRTCTCHHIHMEVTLEARVIHPADIMPDLPSRVLAHRCSRAMSCNLEGNPSCIWAGTNPFIDPFIEPF